MSSQQQPERRDLTNMQRSRYGLKMILYLGMVLLVSWALYMVVFARVPEQNDLDAARVVYSDIVQIQDLPTADITKKGKHRNPGRLIIVGDVHGMLHELTALLAKVQFDKNNDRLILAGDMIAKGPDSPGVVDLAMNLGAMAVRGNHEDRILVADARDVESKEKYHSKEHLSRKDDKDLALARTLGNERLQWLKKCPLILRLGKLGDMGEVVVVHAGLERGVKLQEQDPYMAMNMRTISASGVPSDKRKGEGWTKGWKEYQKSLPKDQRTTVIYGHDSKRGLRMKKYTMGIDTGCVKGGRLTALVIENGYTKPKSKLVQVDCSSGVL